jgi:hypothetical protein
MEKDKVQEVQEKVQETAHQAIEQAQHATEAVAKSFKEWERMRNPWCGWTRVGLGLISPFVLWSNSLLLLVLLVAATLTHPYWFSPYKGPATDVMTKLMDAANSWFNETSKEEKMPIYIAGIGMAVPFVYFTWIQSVFWSAFFIAVIVGFKVTFCQWLLSGYKPKQPGKSKKVSAKKKASTKKKAA